MRRNRLGLLAATALLVLAAIAPSCITTLRVVSVPVARFAYVSNQFSNTISGYVIDDASGTLTEVPGSPFTTADGPRSVAVCISGQLLYVANGGTSAAPGNGVSGFKIDLNTGALTPVPGSPFAGGSAPRRIVVDPTGNFVYTANSGDGTVSGYKINGATGALTQVPGSPFTAQNGPFGVTVDPSGRFVYVTNHFSSSVSGYALNPTTGALTPISGSPFFTDGGPSEGGSGPFGIAVNPSGTYAYVTNHFTGNVTGFSIDPTTGALKLLDSSPYPAGSEPFGIEVAPSGGFVYVVNRGSSDVYAYSVTAGSGALTPIQTSPFSVSAGGECDTSADPYEESLDGTGRFLYVPANAFGDAGCGSVNAFSVDVVGGGLAPLASSPFTAGTGPYGVSVTRTRVE